MKSKTHQLQHTPSARHAGRLYQPPRVLPHQARRHPERTEKGERKWDFSARGLLKAAVLTGIGRTVAVITLAALVFGVFMRGQAAAALGFGAFLFFAWGAVSFAVLNIRPVLIVRQWRLFTGALGLSFAITGLLGLIGANAGSSTGLSLGGSLGITIASAPDQWDWFNVTIGQYMLASLRVGLAFAISFALFAPVLAFKASLSASNAAIGAYGWAAAAVAGTWSKYDSHRFKQEQKRKRTGPSPRADGPDTDAAELLSKAQDAERDAEVLPTAAGKQTARPHVVAAPAAITAPPKPVHVQSLGATVPPTAHPVITGQGASGVARPAVPSIGNSNAAEDARPVIVPPPNFMWKFPLPNVLKVAPPGGVKQSEIDATSQLIVDTLGQHGIDVSVESVRSGPTVTQYGLKPGWEGAPHDPLAAAKRVRVDTILNREKDLALSLRSPSLRFEAPVPGEAVVGIEVPNQKPQMVTMRSVMDTDDFKRFAATAALPVPLGLSTGGEAVFTDLTKMPHLLVAGATGSGKSVCMNAIVTGLLMMRSPYQVRMIMIDPKRVELTPYSGIPHLFSPVVVEPGRAVPILKSLVTEMMNRFKVLEAAGVKNIASFNQKSQHKMPYLVILIDELADLMLTAAGDTERLIVRLAQLGRATGLHLVVATQRPSVDVVTGLIKANFPSRISFAVSSQVDSRTIIDSPGAEKLLGRGDMLFLPVDKPKPQRIQGAFLSDSEAETVVSFWRSNQGPELPQLEVHVDEEHSVGDMSEDDEGDSIVDKAAMLAKTQKTLSTSLLQRRLRIGYPRAARLMDELEEKGIVGPGEPGKPRQVLANA